MDKTNMKKFLVLIRDCHWSWCVFCFGVEYWILNYYSLGDYFGDFVDDLVFVGSFLIFICLCSFLCHVILKCSYCVKKFAEWGDAESQCNLASYHKYGESGFEKSAEEAVWWYRKAAEQGHVCAQRLLGKCYADGEGVKKSVENAALWYRKAAEQGDADAQYLLGECYANGDGVEQSAEKAVVWYRKAAEQGYVIAQAALGECYFYGKGVERSEEKASMWLGKVGKWGRRVTKRKRLK